MKPEMTRREILASAAAAAVAPAIAAGQAPETVPLNVEAGPDRVVMLNGKTYLRGWSGHGNRPRARDPWEKQPAQPAPPDPGTKYAWSKISGPGDVSFENPGQLITTARFSKPGEYTLKLGADNGHKTGTSTLTVSVEQPQYGPKTGSS